MARLPGQRSVTFAVALLLVAVATLVLGGAGLVASRLDAGRADRQLRADANTTADHLAAWLSQSVWNLDRRQAAHIVESAMAERTVAAVEVESSGGEPLAMTRDAAWAPVAGAAPAGLLVTERPILHAGARVGTVRVHTTGRFLEAERRQRALGLAAAIGLVDLLLVAALYLILRRVVLRPLAEIEAYAAAVSAGGAPPALGRRYVGELDRLRRSIASTVGLLDEQARQQGEARRTQREVFEGSRDAILIHDAETGVVLDANRALEDLYGVRREEVLGSTVGLVSAGAPPWTDADARAWLRRARDEGPQLFEWRARRRDGSLFWVEVALSAAVIGGARRVLAVVRDIDARKRIEEEKRRLEEQLAQAQKMESVGRLAGGVAHDFNNLLMVILGEAEVLRGALPAGSPLLAQVGEIERAGRRSRDIARQLLAFSRKQVVRPRLLDLAEALQAVRPTLARLVGEEVSVEVAVAPRLWPVRVDPTQLDQVLINLAANARDAMPAGGRMLLDAVNVAIDAEACRGQPGWRPGEFVRLTARDDGVGMDPETLAHAFEPFFTSKGEGQGTGLGLATVYGIVTQSGGFIDVASRPGVGTTFRIHLPRATVPDAEEPADAARPEPAPARASRGTVLLVEDHDQVRATTERLLVSLGYRVVAASGPEQALALCARSDLAVDVLLTDVVMPSMRGPELQRRLQALRPGLPTLFMSGYSSEFIDRPAGAAAGPLHLLQKPFSRAELADQLERLLRPAPAPAGG